MSKKNNLGSRKRLRDFELRKEKEEREKRAKKLQAKSNKMKVDGSSNKKKMMKKKNGGFQVGKNKVKAKRAALSKAKTTQAMELDN